MPSPSPTEETAVILKSRRHQRAATCSLVLEAVHIPHQLIQTQEGWQLTVAAKDREQALAQLVSYDRENRGWPPRPKAPDQDFRPLFQPPTLLVMGAMALFYSMTGPWQQDSIWFGNGAIDSALILEQGQWWRLITALTLHADLVHLLGNCLIGGVLVHALCQLTGNGLGLFALLACGAAGNGLNVLWHGAGHHAVGFSTAVFGVVGLLSTMSRHRQQRGYRLLMPLMAGAGLLAMLGSSGENTDLGAHLAGLLTGLAAGLLLDHHPLPLLKRSFLFQSLLFVLSWALVVIAWQLALGQAP